MKRKACRAYMKAVGPWMNKAVQMGRRLVSCCVGYRLFNDLLTDFAVSEEEDGDDHQQGDEQRDIDESVTDV